MPKLPGISHQRAVQVFKKAGFHVIREGKHISMTNDQRVIVIPRANPVDAFTLGGIIRDAGLTIEQFREML
jgi:predicted RNA binding protein YcfA (HicA-like mRNA interferase family)